MLLLCVMFIAFINFFTALFYFNIFASLFPFCIFKYVNKHCSAVALQVAVDSEQTQSWLSSCFRWSQAQKMRFSTPAHRLSPDEPF